MRNSGCIIRVIDAIVAVGAAVDNIAALLSQIRRELLLLLETCVVAANGDFHCHDNPFSSRGHAAVIHYS